MIDQGTWLLDKLANIKPGTFSITTDKEGAFVISANGYNYTVFTLGLEQLMAAYTHLLARTMMKDKWFPPSVEAAAASLGDEDDCS